METNLGKTREEIIYELTLGFSRHQYRYAGYQSSVDRALDIYKELKEKQIIIEQN